MGKLSKTEIERICEFIPIIRRECVLYEKSKGIKQKVIAKKFGLTEGAISQYVNDKRGMKHHYLNKMQLLLIVEYIDGKSNDFDELIRNIWSLRRKTNEKDRN